MGYGISVRDLRVLPIKLRAARPGATLFLFAAYTLDLDDQGKSFLTVDKPGSTVLIVGGGVIEGLVLPHNPSRKEVVDAKRERFYRRQLKAAVRRHPEEAAFALSRMGFSVSGPEHE